MSTDMELERIVREPWRTGIDPTQKALVFDANGIKVADCESAFKTRQQFSIPLAEHITLAHNSYEPLREAVATLSDVMHTISEFAVGHGDVCEIIARRARAALARAEKILNERK